jgi:hypothetical protein
MAYDRRRIGLDTAGNVNEPRETTESFKPTGKIQVQFSQRRLSVPYQNLTAVRFRIEVAV